MVKGELVFPDTYNHRLACGNCSSSIGLKIPKGITIYKYALDHECLNCGCKLLSPNIHNYPVSSPSIYIPYGLR